MTTVFVTTIGDRVNFADCLEHLRAQSVVRRIEVIDHVAPMSAAFQRMHDHCTTPYYVQVDEDMILFPSAVADLEARMTKAPEEVAMICAPLWDCDTELPIYGLKIYRHAIVRQFPYENTLSCEVQQMDRMRAAGFRVELLPMTDRSTCAGEHGKHYTLETIFKRWQRIFLKHGQLGNSVWIEPWAEKLLTRYIATREPLHLYAFLGAVAGITGDSPVDCELDWREPNAALERARKYFPPMEGAALE